MHISSGSATYLRATQPVHAVAPRDANLPALHSTSFLPREAMKREVLAVQNRGWERSI